MKTVAVIGKGKVACHIVDYFHKHEEWRLKYVVPMLPEPSWCPSLIRATPWYTTITDHHKKIGKVDLVVSSTYERILKKKFLDRQGLCINIHNSPLPKYAGTRPINWALKNGEYKHGVTIHRITEGIDDGPIYAQSQFAINPVTDEVEDVYNRCIDYGMALFNVLIENIFTITPFDQESTLRTYYSNNDLNKLGNRSNWTRAISNV